jgi:hypothetical protein
MRNPDRIDRIAEKLRRAWHEVPDWRLGQLVSNLLGPGPQDVFFLEDNEWEKLLDELISEARSASNGGDVNGHA